jgi:hypothetical protein
MDPDNGDSHQLCVISCQGNDIAYYWSVIHWRSRNAVGFRGFSATFPVAGVAREIMDFTLQGPLIGCLADLQGVAQVQAIEMSGSAANPGTPPNDIPFDVKVLVALAPQLAPGGRNPHGAILSMKNETEGGTVATIADIHYAGDYVFVLLVAAIAAVAVNGGQALIDRVMFDNSTGDLEVKITTPIGTVTVNKPFSAVPGLLA